MSAAVLLAVLATTPWVKLDDDARAKQAQELKRLPLSDRLASVAEGFLGTPYVLSPLGEGAGHDPDPLIRYDALDCVTLVEETMALALAPGRDQLLPTLNQIRYSGAPAWETRNHITEAQWLPHLVEAGYLKDVARRWGGDDTRVLKKVFTDQTWKTKMAQGLALPESARPRGEFSLDVLPPSVAVEKLSRAPSGLVLVVVRSDRPWLVTRVSHVAMLLQTRKGPMLRHASRTSKKVVDESLAGYLKRNLDYGQWTIEGLAVYEVQTPPSLAAAAPP